MRKVYHIKMTHKGNDPAMLDNSESAILAGFDDPMAVLAQWQKDTWDYYTKRFDGLSREILDQKCLNTLRDQYDQSIRRFKPTKDLTGSVYVLQTINGYDIAIHYNSLTLKEVR